MGALVAAMAVGRGIAPLVGKLQVIQLSSSSFNCFQSCFSLAVSTYLAVDRHSWLPMIIFVSLEFLALVAFLFLYRTMKPQKVCEVSQDLL